MLKKLVMLLVVFAVVVNASAIQVMGATIISDNFDNFEGSDNGQTAPGGWTVASGTPNVAGVYSEENIVKSGKSLKVHNTSTNQLGFFRGVAGEGIITSEFSIYFDDMNTNREIGIRAIDAGGNNVDGHSFKLLMNFEQNGDILLADRRFSNIEYDTEKWYDVKLTKDFNTKAISAEISGDLVVDGNPASTVTIYSNMDARFTKMNRLSFYFRGIAGQPSITYLDDVKVYKGTDFGPVVSLEENFEDYTDAGNVLPADWTATNYDTNIISLAPINTAGNGTSVSITSNGEGEKQFLMNRDFAPYTPHKARISYDIYFVDNHVDRQISVRGRNSSAQTAMNANDVLVTFEKTTDKILLYGNDTGRTYETGKWYTASIVYDCTTKQVILYINGERVAEDVTTAGLIDIGRTFIKHHSLPGVTSTTYVDNVVVQTDVESTFISSTPTHNSIGVVYGAGNLEAKFSGGIDITDAVALINDSSEDVEGILMRYNTLLIKTKQLLPMTPYSVKVSGLKDVFGNHVADVEFSFTTASKYTITDVRFEMNGDDSAQQLEEGDLYSSVRIQTNDNGSHPVVFVTALYTKDGIKLVDMELDCKAAVGQERLYSTTLEIPSDASDYKVITYIWDSLNNMMPLTNSTTFGE